MEPLSNLDLREAIWRDDVSLITDCIENRGFEVNRTAYSGLTALQQACSIGGQKLVKYLVTKAEADWNTTTEQGDTTAHLACRAKYEDKMVKTLWESVESVLHKQYQSEGIDLKEAKKTVDAVKKKFFNTQNDRGETCLHSAMFDGTVESVRYLVRDVEVDWTLTTKDGNTAAHYACQYTNVLWLKALWESVEWVLRDRCEDEGMDREATNDVVYVEKKKLLDKQNGEGETCLHRALQNRVDKYSTDIRDGIITWLIENGANTGPDNNNGKTAWEVCRDTRDALLGIDAMSWFFLRNAEHVATSEEQEQPEWFRNMKLGYPWNKLGDEEVLNYFYDSDFGDLPPNQWFYVPVNKRSLFWALLRKLSSFEEHSKLGGLNKILFSSEVGEALAPYELENTRIREPLCAWESLGSSKKEDPTKKEDSSTEELLSLVMPYLYSENADVYANDAVAVENRKDQSEKIDSSNYHFNGSKVQDLYPPVTLDEYCKPALSQSILDVLNADQVLTRANKRDQVWVWKIRNVVITAFPREAYESKNLFNGDLYDVSNVDDQFLGIGSLLSQLIDTINRPVMAGLSEPVLNTFENEIVKVSTDLKAYMDNLADAKVDDINVNKEIGFYHEILDIQEELGMVKSVILQQENVWKDFISGVWPKYWSEGGNRELIAPNSSRDGWYNRRNINIIVRTQRHIEQLKNRIQQLDEAAERVKETIGIQLDLKSKQATMKEAHSTAIMSAAVFGFTLVTIIFTPLGFAISLFGLPIEDFKKTGDDQYTSGYIGKWLTITEVVVLVLTLLAMWAAVRYGLKSRVRDLFRMDPKNPSPALDSTRVAATDKKLNHTQHGHLRRRRDGKNPTMVLVKAKDEDVGHMA